MLNKLKIYANGVREFLEGYHTNFASIATLKHNHFSNINWSCFPENKCGPTSQIFLYYIQNYTEFADSELTLIVNAKVIKGRGEHAWAIGGIS